MKWIEAAKEGQDYVLSAELKEKRDTIEAEAAEVLKKSGATPCTLYGIADGSPVVSSVEIGIKDGEDYVVISMREMVEGSGIQTTEDAARASRMRWLFGRLQR